MPGSAQVNYHPYAFESPGHWEKAGLQFDKATFTNRLHGVREIRNKGSIRDSQRKIGGFGAGKEIEKQSIQTVSCAGEWGQAIPQEGGTTDEDSA